MVFYRKYRPQIIDDLDSKQVRETLISVFSKDTPSHAFLFTGPKGLGKTSSARIVAKVVNCTGRGKGKASSIKTEEKKDLHPSRLTLNANIEPCGKCDSCVSITNGTNMDVLEIDAASNRGIDEIRDLKEKIKLSPLSARMKVYIIDEVHMLTTEAFNALLKTLEEPPQHAMFVLCTTEPQKVPATILSRCFHVAFKKATDDELVRSFMRIAKGEGLSVDKDALLFIAKLSDGAFRDGAKILEEVSLQAGKKPITKKLIEEKYQVTSLQKYIDDLLLYLKEKKTNEALLLVSRLAEQGTDMRYFIQQLIETLHQDLLERVRSDKKQDQTADVDSIKSLLKLFMNAYTEMKHAVVSQLPLELAIIDWARADSPKEVIADAIEGVLQGGDTEVSISTLRKKVGTIKKITAMYGDEKKASPKKDDKEIPEHKVTLLHTSNGEITKEWLMLFWNNLISEMKTYNHTIAGVLRGCRIHGFDKNVLVIETAYKFHKERLDDVKTMRELSRVAKLLTGKDVKVEVQLVRDK